MKKLFLLLTVIFLLAMSSGQSFSTCTQAIPSSFKMEVLKGTHLSTDTYNMALFVSASASYSASSTVYSGTGESSGAGYSAGGMALTGISVSNQGAYGVLTWSSPSWSSASITADCMVIYNASKSNKLVYIGTFTSTTSTNGTFTVVLPSAASGGVIELQ
jgi:hypothetical protein